MSFPDLDLESLSLADIKRLARGELERRRKISETKTDVPHSPETNKKISEGIRRYYANGGVHWRARRQAEQEDARR